MAFLSRVVSWLHYWKNEGAVLRRPFLPSLEMLEQRCQPAVSITEFPIPTPVSGPSDITVGPDGNLWFTEGRADQIGKITTAGTVTEFGTGITANSSPLGITAGPDGNLWFTENANATVGRITPTGTVTQFPSGNQPFGITAGPDGNLWFAEDSGNAIGRMTITGSLMQFSAGLTPNSSPFDITTGPDGNLWFTEFNASRIGRITTNGTITEFFTGITPGAGPQDITAGPDGNLWFTEFLGNRIGRITPTGTITEFPLPTSGSGPFGITTGPDGNLWFTELNVNQIGRITPAGVVTEFTGLSGGSSPTEITLGPDNKLWFTEFNGNRIGQLSILPEPTQTTVSTSVNPATFGQSVTFTAQVTAMGSPTGSVTFFDGSTMLGSVPLSSSMASFSTSSLAVGSHSITAAYNATGNFAPSTSAALTETIVAPPLPPLPPPPPPVTKAAGILTSAGAGSDGASQVTLYDINGKQTASFYIFDPVGFHGGITVARADVNGDGTLDIICAAGPGGGPQVVIIDGTKLNQLQSNGEIAGSAVIASFYAFSPTFSGGVFVAAGTSSSGQNWIAAGAGAGGGPQVIVWTTKAVLAGAAAGTAPTVLTSFYAFASGFGGGVTVALGDVNGDGKLDVIAGAGLGGGPQVIVVDGTKFSSIPSTGILPSGALLASFEAFAPGFTGGVFVSGGVTSGTQFNLIIGAGLGGGPQVIVVNGAQVGQVSSNGVIASSALLGSFYAQASTSTDGVRVGFSAVYSSSGKPAILTGPGPGAAPQVAPFDGGTFAALNTFFALPQGFLGGLFIAG